MLKVGITGGIGSGKTIICKVFSQLGIPVLNADAVATEVYYRKEVQQQIKKTFGEGLTDSAGIVDRALLANLVFSDKDLLMKLNAIIHPAVELEAGRWIAQNCRTAYVLKEAAILFESGTYKGLDKIITITSPVELRIARVMKREGWSRKTIEQRMLNQWTDEEKIKRSDFVINNDETQLLIPQILKIHEKLIAV